MAPHISFQKLYAAREHTCVIMLESASCLAIVRNWNWLLAMWWRVPFSARCWLNRLIVSIWICATCQLLKCTLASRPSRLSAVNMVWIWPAISYLLLLLPTIVWEECWLILRVVQHFPVSTPLGKCLVLAYMEPIVLPATHCWKY